MITCFAERDLSDLASAPNLPIWKLPVDSGNVYVINLITKSHFSRRPTKTLHWQVFKPLTTESLSIGSLLSSPGMNELLIRLRSNYFEPMGYILILSSCTTRCSECPSRELSAIGRFLAYHSRVIRQTKLTFRVCFVLFNVREKEIF